MVISLAGSRAMIRESKGRDQEQGHMHVHDLLIDFLHAGPMFSVVILYVSYTLYVDVLSLP